MSAEELAFAKDVAAMLFILAVLWIFSRSM